MFYSNTVVGSITRQLREAELDELVRDVFSLKKRCRSLGNLGGKPNYIMNVYDETRFDEVSEMFEGNVTIYYETTDRDDSIAADIGLLMAKYEIQVVSLTRKLKV